MTESSVTDTATTLVETPRETTQQLVNRAALIHEFLELLEDAPEATVAFIPSDELLELITGTEGVGPDLTVEYQDLTLNLEILKVMEEKKALTLSNEGNAYAVNGPFINGQKTYSDSLDAYISTLKDLYTIGEIQVSPDESKFLEFFLEVTGLEDE